MKGDKDKLSFFSAVFLLMCFASFAQQNSKLKPDQYRAVHWSGRDGLPLGLNHKFLKDHKGFLWVGSTKGIGRFDGSIFRAYPSGNAPGAIISNDIENLVEDSLHNIWTGSYLGLSRYDIRADTFTNFFIPNDTTLPRWYNGTVPFWATKDEVFCIEPGLKIASYNIRSLARHEIKRFYQKDYMPNGISRISTIYDELSNSLWLLNPHGLIQYSLATGRISSHNYDVAGHGFAEGMCFDRKRNSIWINELGGLTRFSLTDTRFYYNHALDHFKNLEHYRPFPGIDIDVAGRIWLSTNPGGILIYDPETKNLIQPFSDPTLQSRVAADTWKLYCDKDGLAWVSNYVGDGFYQIVPKVQPVKRFFANPKKTGFLSNSMISTILPGPQGKLWIGTDDGLNILDPVTGTFDVLREKDLPGIEGTSILPIYVDTISQIAWISASRQPPINYYLYEMDLKTRLCRRVVFKEGQRIIDQFTVDHTLVRPYNGGILLCDEKSGVFEIKARSLTAELTIHARGFGAMALIDDQYLFLQSGGTPPNYTYENRNGKWVKTPHQLDSLNWHCFFYNTSDQTFWISFTDTLVHFDKQFRKLRTYLGNSSFKGIIMSMQTDRAGNLWMINYESKEIWRLDPNTGIYSRLGEADGYLQQQYGWYAPIATDVRGDLYFGSGWFTAGVASPDWGLDRISPEKYASLNKPPVYFQSLMINQKPFALFKDLDTLNELKLRHYQNTLRIEAGIIDFYSKEKGNIRYKIEHDGKVSEWQYPLDKVIRYEEMTPGSYKLTLQASNSAGEYIGPEKTLLVNISPAFWQTWWFRILAVLAVIAILYGFLQYRSHDLKKRNIILEKKVSERTNELSQSLSDLKIAQDQLIHAEKMASLGELTSGIAHEIKNPLNFINNFSEINMELAAEMQHEQTSKEEAAHMMKTLIKNLEKVNHHGKRVDEIVKGMLAHSRIGNVNRELVNINSLCEESLKLAYHGFRAKEKSFNVEFEKRFDPDLPNVMVVPQDIGRVLLNLFNNAFYAVHEKKKKIKLNGTDDALQTESLYKPCVIVSTRKSGNKISIEVSDNGTGIPASIVNKIFQPFFTTKPTGEGTGLGLSMSYDIITKSHGGEFLVKSKEGLGTDIEILLPN